MRAILLAAGYGERLRPITDTIPKCLVPIAGKPLLAHWLNNLRLAGIDSILVNTHYLKERVESFIENSEFSPFVELVYEEKLLGTAGTLIKNINFFKCQDGLLIHADNFCDIDFKEFMIAHAQRPKQCVMTMLTFRTKNPSACGVIELDSQKIVRSFYEKVENPPSNLANGAIYLLSPGFFEIFKSDFQNASDFSVDVVGKLLGRIFTYEAKGYFIDIGTIEAYKEALALNLK